MREVAQRQDVSRAPPLLSWWSAGHPEAEGSPWWREAVPLSLRNWGSMVEMLYYLQVAPFPKKLFRHQVHGCRRRCSILTGSGSPPLHPGRAICGLLLASTFFRPSLVCPSIFLHTPAPLYPGDEGDCEALHDRLPPVPRMESVQGWPSSLQTALCWS